MSQRSSPPTRIKRPYNSCIDFFLIPRDANPICRHRRRRRQARGIPFISFLRSLHAIRTRSTLILIAFRLCAQPPPREDENRRTSARVRNRINLISLTRICIGSPRGAPGAARAHTIINHIKILKMRAQVGHELHARRASCACSLMRQLRT